MLEQTAKLGKLESVHGVSRKYLRRVLIIAAICLFIFVCGMYLAFAEYQHNPVSFPRIEDTVGFFVCGIVPLGVFFFALWAIFRKGRATVKVYEHGFVHRVGKQTRICEWTEIKNTFIEIGDPKYLLQVEKLNGETIFLTEAIEGVQQIAERIDREIACLSGE